jgi:signal transduction histidine kinase
MDAQEDERRRVAQELHDETSQALASLQLGLERLASMDCDPEQARELANHLRGVASGTLAEVHRLAVELRPSALDDLGLVAALERYLDGFPTEQGLEVDFAPVGVENIRLRPEAETAVYRIVQAALTNIVQHAGASHVSVLLEKRDRKLVLVVEDDGRGFDLAAVHAAPLEARLGLAGMEERATLIGAQLTIETAPGRGCTLFLEVSLDS